MFQRDDLPWEHLGSSDRQRKVEEWKESCQFQEDSRNLSSKLRIHQLLEDSCGKCRYHQDKDLHLQDQYHEDRSDQEHK